jgi:hypothetical protein
VEPPRKIGKRKKAMRRDVFTGGVFVGVLVALVISTGWKKRSVPAGSVTTKAICAGKVPTSVPVGVERPPDELDLIDRYRRAAAI